jgi:hypothetical protein
MAAKLDKSLGDIIADAPKTGRRGGRGGNRGGGRGGNRQGGGRQGGGDNKPRNTKYVLLLFGDVLEESIRAEILIGLCFSLCAYE